VSLVDISALTDSDLRALATPDVIAAARERCCDGCKAPELYCDAACADIFASTVAEFLRGGTST
jgi:hypothetical protein